MTDGPVIPPPSGGTPLVARVTNILTKPASEWRVIDGEASSMGKLITYAAILALIAPIAMLIGLLLTPLGTYIFGAMGFLIKILLIVYVISLGTVVLLGFIIDLLAPNLGGTKNAVQSMKLAVYAGTAFFVAALGLILSQWIWVLVGIGYGGYLVWIGLPILMRVPADKAQVFTGAVVGIWLVLFIILQQIGWRVMFAGMFTGGMM